MKPLSKCTPREFIKQTNLLRKKLPNYLEATGILDIRKRTPEGLDSIAMPTTADEMTENIKERDELWAKQARKNIYDMLDQMLEKHEDETLELLAIICCVEPAKVNEHVMSEYIACLDETLTDEAVMGFFISLAKLGEKI